jgi:hypothetical protein
MSGGGGYVHTDLVRGVESFTSVSRFDEHTAVYPTPAFCLAVGRHSGPVIRRIEFSPETHDMIDLDVTEEQEGVIWQWCRECIDQSVKDGAGYDWFGVMRFAWFIPWARQHPEDWFCSEADVTALQQVAGKYHSSELVAKALQGIGVLAGKKAWYISPNKLWQLFGGNAHRPACPPT